MTTSTTGNEDIINPSNAQLLLLDNGQQSKDFDPGSMTISSASTRSTSNLQLDEQQVPASGEPLLECKGQTMLKSIVNAEQYDLFRELRGLVRISEMQARRDDPSTYFATTSDEEWWLATAKKALIMETDQLMTEINEDIDKMQRLLKERFNNNEIRDPGTEAPEGRQKTKDATTSSSEEDAQTPPGGTTKKRRNYHGDEIGGEYDADFKMLPIKDPLLKTETPTSASSMLTKSEVTKSSSTYVPISSNDLHLSTKLNSTPEGAEKKAKSTTSDATSTMAPKTPNPGEVQQLFEEEKEEEEHVSFKVDDLMGQIRAQVHDVVNTGIDTINAGQQQHAQVIQGQLQMICERVDVLEQAKATSTGVPMGTVHQAQEMEQELLHLRLDLTVSNREFLAFMAQVDMSVYLHMNGAKDKLWEQYEKDPDEYVRVRERHDMMDGCKIKDAMQRKVQVLVDGNVEVMQYTMSHLFQDLCDTATSLSTVT